MKDAILKLLKVTLMILITLILFSSNSSAVDYDWMKDFNIKAGADLSGLKARLEARFQIGDAKIEAAIGSVDKPADAYMLLRLGEISNKPIEQVIEEYKVQKDKGWGVLAKGLGIKPGSKAFHDLKQGQDLYDDRSKGMDKEKSKGKGKKRK